MRNRSSARRDTLPPSVRRVVSSPGRRLDPPARATMEARFGHDFSRIRVHDDGEAADSARDVGARAYSAGAHLVFGPGGYAPGTRAGDALLAHELAHAVQHERGHAVPLGRAISAPASPDEREAARASDQVASGQSAGPLTAHPSASLHREPEPFETFAESGDLRAYLRRIRRTGRIEGDDDSDDKAVRIVRLWSAGSFERLDGKDKAILVWELLDGPTTAPDEQAIVDLLERSSNADLDKIFRFQGEAIQRQIAEDVPDGEGSQLADFCRRRWVGGIEEFRKGGGFPRAAGVPMPLGAPLPKPRRGRPEPLPTLPPPDRPGRATAASALDVPGIDPRQILRPQPQPPAWTPVPEAPAVDGPPVPAGPFPRPAPYPATGLDFLKAFLATEKGTQIKDDTLKLLEKMAGRATPAEGVAIILNVLATVGIFTGVTIGALSEQQRLQIWNLFTSDQDVNLLRPMDQKVIGPPTVTF